MRTTKAGTRQRAEVALTRAKPLRGTLRKWALGLLLTAAGLSQAWAGVSVTLTAPANGASFTAPATITLTATASATQGYTVQKVEFFHSGTVLIGTATTSPYSFDWTNVPAGSYTLTAKATAVKKNQPNQTATSIPVGITVATANVPPTVSLTSPANGASFTAPANITLTATAADSDGTLQKVEFFHGGTNLITTLTAPPYSVLWTSVPPGAYTLTAVATDNLNAATTSAPINITVGAAAAQLYFIHTDHLNTPRLITNATGQAVWRWDNTDPFGGNPPDENPSGLGIFSCNLRLPGQYFDKETNLHYNYFRDYDAAIGRYIQSDPIGLAGGINTYAYVDGNPLSTIDPLGLMGRGSGANPNGKWANCSRADWKFCEQLCGSRGVKSCRRWWSIRTEMVDGQLVKGWKPAPEPSCNCNEECPDPSPSPSPSPKGSGDDFFDQFFGDQQKRRSPIFGPFPTLPRPLPIP